LEDTTAMNNQLRTGADKLAFYENCLSSTLVIILGVKHFEIAGVY
jgi:hypothetical protein